jgi:AAA domain
VALAGYRLALVVKFISELEKRPDGSRVSDSHYGINLLVHGPPKGGKSFFGDTTPAPRLVLDAEAGSRFTPSRKIRWDPTRERPPEPDGSWDTALVPVTSFPVVLKAYEWLASGQHHFRSAVLDSVSEIQAKAVDDLTGTKQMQLQDWGTLLRVVSDVIRKYRDLVANPVRPLDAVVFTAMTRKVDDRWKPFAQGQLGVTLSYYFDIVGYLAPVTLPETGEVTRRLFTGSFEGFETGERVGGCLGSYLDNPRISDMLGTIRSYLDAGMVSADATADRGQVR